MNTALEYINAVLARNAKARPVTPEPPCRTCLGEGMVVTRREDLDETWMAEVWVTEACPDCQKGKDLHDSFESQMFAAQDRW